MRRKITVALVGFGALVSSLLVSTPAAAHGYISSPPSRQAMCAMGRVSDCGPIIWEPQSVEAPKGSHLCSGGNDRFLQLDDPTKNWPATSVGHSVTFTWTITAHHATRDWEYFVGDTRVGYFDANGSVPGDTVTQTVDLSGYSGRILLLARWNIADTANAFYSCVDLQIGSGGGQPSPTPTTSSPSPSPTPTASTSPTSQPSGTWAAGTAYHAGDEVTYQGTTYRCLQDHTALPGWEPPSVPALWQPV